MSQLLQSEIVSEIVSESESVDAASTAAERGAHADEGALLKALGRLWKTHHRRGVDVRHRTGVLLNRHLGPPTERQPYGAAVLRRCSAALGVAESDLSRMRWFAHAFESVADLAARHPDATTWTQVRALLAALRRPDAGPADDEAGGGPHGPPPAESRPATVRKLVGAVRSVREYAGGVGQLAPGGDDWRALRAAVADMLAAVEACLGVRYAPVTDAPGVEAV